jgi:hypothetical protein
MGVRVLCSALQQASDHLAMHPILAHTINSLDLRIEHTPRHRSNPQNAPVTQRHHPMQNSRISYRPRNPPTHLYILDTLSAWPPISPLTSLTNTPPPPGFVHNLTLLL